MSCAFTNALQGTVVLSRFYGGGILLAELLLLISTILYYNIVFRPVSHFQAPAQN